MAKLSTVWDYILSRENVKPFVQTALFTFRVQDGEGRKALEFCWFNCFQLKISGQFITTSAEVTPNGGLVRESPPKWP